MRRTRTQVLRSLRGRPRSFWSLARSVRAPLRDLAAELRSLQLEGLIEYDERSGTFSLGAGDIEAHGAEDAICPTCCGKGRILPQRHAQTLEAFKGLVMDRPRPRTEFDQGYMRPEDVAHRALLMEELGDLEDRHIILLGDDDLLSLYLALLDGPGRIVAMDLDQELLSYIQRKSREASLKVETRAHDLARPLPEDLQHSFEVFSTEPVESLKGLKEFCRRGLEALSDNDAAGYIGLTVHESSWAKWRAFESFLLEEGFAITDILSSFSLYPSADWPEEMVTSTPLAREFGLPLPPPDVDWYSSSLIRVERAPSMAEEGDLYRDSETWFTPESL
jgi:predicted methyltransferase